jgi:hypothetical protein
MPDEKNKSHKEHEAWTNFERDNAYMKKHWSELNDEK